jgi:dipeptidyl aminopeptidase/acylaminoacyl peptidase
MAYVHSDRRELWIANRDGAEARRVEAAGEGVAAPRWLPDSGHLVFVRDGRVWLIDAAGAGDGGDGGAGAVPISGKLGRSRETPVAPAHEPADLSPDLAEQLYSVAP